MPLTGNKGEWSEIYALFKLLGDKQIFAGDADLKKIEALFYPIIKILRSETTGDFEYSVNGDLIFVSEGGVEKLRIESKIFTEQAVGLLQEIKKATGSSFSIPDTEAFMQSVQCKTLKAKSTDKTDVRIVIHDLKTNLQPLLGFSIKSQIGGASTLLNAGQTTNFIYKISGNAIDAAKVAEINLIETGSKIRDRIAAIKALGNDLQFNDMENVVFKNNLVLIDSLLPQIMSEIILNYYTGTASTIKEIVKAIEASNPLKYDTKNAHRFYEYKVKRFLTDIALGMMPSKVWDGIYDANGGYLIVREDGEVLCYHIYNKNEFENYLFSNTKLDTASSNRHGFGKIEVQNGEASFKLNLQIRFL